MHDLNTSPADTSGAARAPALHLPATARRTASRFAWTRVGPSVAAGILLAGPALAAGPFQEREGSAHVERVYWDSLDASGRLFGGSVELVTPEPGSVSGVLPAAWTPLDPTQAAVNPANRIDLVFVGDGYTAAELPQYASQVATISANFFNKAPYSTYEPYFTLHRVDVISNESGVDNDPVQGVQKDTELNMGFWCSGIERLLCVSVGKALQYAGNAPDVDLVAAVANSSKYGGAGYPSNDLATVAAGNGSALEIVRHEFGHALGNLADEYDYGGPTTYTGPEPSQANVSKLNAAAMAAAGAKWAQWLGVNDPLFDGLVSTFEGAAYSSFGIYRPTNNSLMRNLGRPFNLPSVERMIVEIYKVVDPIDAASDTSVVYAGSETLFVTPMVPATHTLDVQWLLGGAPIPGATGTTLDLSTLGLGSCWATVSVRVVDNTPLVTAQALRDQYLTQTLDFSVQPGPTPPIATYCVSSANSSGQAATIAWTGSSSLARQDLVLLAFNAAPNVPGLFITSPNAAQTPLGNGTLCVAAPIKRLPLTPSDLFGIASYAFDPFDLGGGGPLAAGETRYFQYWFRDPAAGGAAFDFSDGLSVLFCP